MSWSRDYGNIWKCRKCHKQFSVKVGTIFEDSAIPLGKWLVVTWQLVNCKNGVSSYEIAKAIGVTQKSSWFMLQRIRKAMQDDLKGGKLAGEVEVDETYIGCKARFMHKNRRAKVTKHGSKTMGKVAVMGLLERNADGASKVRLKVLENARKHNVHAPIHEHFDLIIDGSDNFREGLNGWRDTVELPAAMV